MKNALIFIFLGLGLTSALGQGAKVYLLDAVDSTALEGAHILDLAGNQNRVSNEDGLIERPHLKGSWKVSHIGYHSQWIREWEHIDSLFLQARDFELETVELYGFNLAKYLKQCISASVNSNQGISGPFLLRKRARTNGKITQLFQVQVQAKKKELLLCGIDYAAQSDLEISLAAGGYIESEYLLDQLKVNYPLRYLLRYLIDHEVTEVRVDPEVVNVSFRGTLKDAGNAVMALQAGKLIFSKSDRRLLRLEWVSRPELNFKYDYSKRYRQRYSLAIKRIHQSWDFDRLKEGLQKLRKYKTSVELFVRVKRHIDEVVLENHIIPGLIPDHSFECRVMDSSKPLIDQLDEVSPSHSDFLLSKTEKKFLKSNDDVH